MDPIQLNVITSTSQNWKKHIKIDDKITIDMDKDNSHKTTIMKKLTNKLRKGIKGTPAALIYNF